MGDVALYARCIQRFAVTGHPSVVAVPVVGLQACLAFASAVIKTADDDDLVGKQTALIASRAHSNSFASGLLHAF